MANFDEVFAKVSEMIADAKDLDCESLTPETLLSQLKLDSLDYVELMVLSKREFGKALSADDFIKNPNMSLGELCQLLAA